MTAVTPPSRFAPLAEPFTRFAEWLARAVAELPRQCFPDPNAMSVATVDAEGRPSNRIVLLKAHDERGFVFYTNYEGRKGRELFANPACALCFHWPPLERQVRIEGRAEPVAPEEADAYFASRARESQLGAWASHQSEVMDTRDALERRLAEMTQRFAGGPVPRPPHWSGFRVVPRRMEFWTNRPSRLHERELFLRDDDAPAETPWRVEHLFP